MIKNLKLNKRKLGSIILSLALMVTIKGTISHITSDNTDVLTELENDNRLEQIINSKRIDTDLVTPLTNAFSSLDIRYDYLSSFRNDLMPKEEYKTDMLDTLENEIDTIRSIDKENDPEEYRDMGDASGRASTDIKEIQIKEECVSNINILSHEINHFRQKGFHYNKDMDNSFAHLLTETNAFFNEILFGDNVYDDKIPFFKLSENEQDYKLLLQYKAGFSYKAVSSIYLKIQYLLGNTFLEQYRTGNISNNPLLEMKKIVDSKYGEGYFENIMADIYLLYLNRFPIENWNQHDDLNWYQNQLDYFVNSYEDLNNDIKSLESNYEYAKKIVKFNEYILSNIVLEYERYKSELSFQIQKYQDRIRNSEDPEFIEREKENMQLRIQELNDNNTLERYREYVEEDLAYCQDRCSTLERIKEDPEYFERRKSELESYVKIFELACSKGDSSTISDVALDLESSIVSLIERDIEGIDSRGSLYDMLDNYHFYQMYGMARIVDVDKSVIEIGEETKYFEGDDPKKINDNSNDITSDVLGLDGLESLFMDKIREYGELPIISNNPNIDALLPSIIMRSNTPNLNEVTYKVIHETENSVIVQVLNPNLIERNASYVYADTTGRTILLDAKQLNLLSLDGVIENPIHYEENRHKRQ